MFTACSALGVLAVQDATDALSGLDTQVACVSGVPGISDAAPGRSGCQRNAARPVSALFLGCGEGDSVTFALLAHPFLTDFTEGQTAIGNAEAMISQSAVINEIGATCASGLQGSIGYQRIYSISMTRRRASSACGSANISWKHTRNRTVGAQGILSTVDPPRISDPEGA